MRITFFILISLTTISCSRSVYYAYQKGDTYATLELTKGNNLIYRAKSDDFYYNENSNFKKYLYITSLNIDKQEDNFLSIGENFTMLYLNNIEEEGYNGCISKRTKDFLWNSYIRYEKKSLDSLSLLWTPEIKKKLLKEPCFKKTGITWFPPYLKKIKKIDYKKFKLPYKKKYLRTMNPKHR